MDDDAAGGGTGGGAIDVEAEVDGKYEFMVVSYEVCAAALEGRPLLVNCGIGEGAKSVVIGGGRGAAVGAGVDVVLECSTQRGATAPSLPALISSSSPTTAMLEQGCATSISKLRLSVACQPMFALE